MYVIKLILIEMNDSASFTLTPIIDMMEKPLHDKLGASSQVTLNANITDHDVWDKELDVLFGEYDENGNRTKEGIITLMKFNVNEVSYDTLKTNNAFGQMLDMMDDSEIFSGSVNQIVRELVQMTSLYPSIITTSDLDDSKLNNVRLSEGGWTKELAILTSVDPVADVQDGAIIDVLRKSIILGDRLPDFIWEVVEDEGLDQYIDNSTFLTAYNEVEAKIALGEATPDDDTDDYSWAKEVATLKQFASQLEIVKANPLVGTAELVNIASQSVIAGYMINNVINSLI